MPRASGWDLSPENSPIGVGITWRPLQDLGRVGKDHERAHDAEAPVPVPPLRPVVPAPGAKGVVTSLAAQLREDKPLRAFFPLFRRFRYSPKRISQKMSEGGGDARRNRENGKQRFLSMFRGGGRREPPWLGTNAPLLERFHLLFALPELSDPRQRQHLQPRGTAGREGDAPSQNWGCLTL